MIGFQIDFIGQHVSYLFSLECPIIESAAQVAKHLKGLPAMKKTAQQKAIDNRANQLNPNNPAYHKSRSGNTKNGKAQGKTTTIVVHHHNHSVKAPIGNQTRVCPICGATGNVSFVKNECKKFSHILHREIGKKTVLKCHSCGGTFSINRID